MSLIKGVYDGHDEVGIGMLDDGVFDGSDEFGNGMHDEVGTGMPGEGVCDGPDEFTDLHDEGGNGTSRVTNRAIERAPDKVAERAVNEENDELVETDYEQEEEDIAVDTCVDPTRDWDSLRNPEIPREECGSCFEFDCEDDDLRNLDDFDDKEVEGGQPRNFIKTKYYEFDHVHDMANPIFKIGMEFGSAYVFKKAIRAHSIKHRRNNKFQKNDPNRVKPVCKDKGCNWFVFASWLGDHKTFKIKFMVDAHSYAMTFKNMFVNSKMIADKYLGQWREKPNWNFVGMSQQLRSDTNVDASIWQCYRARIRAKELIQGSIKDQYSKLWEYCTEVRRMNSRSSVIIKCSSEDGDVNPKFIRLYICLHDLKKGWKEGRKDVSVLLD
ncbi:hypothetical protein LWI28_001321 [Acer negundo]|uniref:Transposase MuDR plant domain-containing protein n=1 Tax=Acer negundo TaxID=4023 RepID=A0AAD5J2A9_ACENE|nr:hypothetical protein LWI28_001321 [Acer negundo]